MMYSSGNSKMEGCCGKFHLKRFVIGRVTMKVTRCYWKWHYLIDIGSVSSLLTSFSSCVSDLQCLQYILTCVNHMWLVLYGIDWLMFGWLVLTQYHQSRSATNIILVTYNWLFLSICFTLSLESTPYFCPPTLSHSSVSDLPPTTSYHSVNTPLSQSITPSLFHSRLKTYLFPP